LGFSSAPGSFCQRDVVPSIFGVSPLQMDISESNFHFTVSGSGFSGRGMMCNITAIDASFSLISMREFEGDDETLVCAFLAGSNSVAITGQVIVGLVVETELGRRTKTLNLTIFNKPVLQQGNNTLDSGQLLSSGEATVIFITGTGIPFQLPRPGLVRCRFGEDSFSNGVLDGLGSVSCTVPVALQMGVVAVAVSLNGRDLISSVLTFQYFKLQSSELQFGSNAGGSVIKLSLDADWAALSSGNGLWCAFGNASMAPVYVLDNSYACTTQKSSLVGEYVLRLTGNGMQSFGEGERLFTFHRELSLISISASSGPTSGNTTLAISGDFPVSPMLTVPRCRLEEGNNVVIFEAEIVTSSLMICITPPTPTSASQLQVSVNGVDFIVTPWVFSFEPCAAGSVSRGFSEPCTLCSAGQFQKKAGEVSCQKCEKDEYVAGFGNTACDLCPLNTLIGDVAASEQNSMALCECDEKFFSPSTPSQMYFNGTTSLPHSTTFELHTTITGKPCMSCPDFAVCPGGSRMPVVETGVWIDLEYEFGNKSLFQCPTASSCTGVWRACEDFDKCRGKNFTLCRKGTRGTLCSGCSQGFYEQALFCLECSGGKYEMWFVLGGVVGIAISAALLIQKCVLRGKALPTTAYAPLSIGLNFWQILALFQSIRLDWPPPVRFMFTLVSLSNMNIEVIRSECTFPMPYLTKLWLVCSGPTILGTLCIAILAVMAIKKGRKWWARTSAQVACILFSISFVGVASSALSAFACSENVDGTVMLQKDPEVHCTTGTRLNMEWALNYGAPALFWLLLYVTACPALFVLYLQRQDRHTLWDNSSFVHQAFAMMYRKFRMDFYAWELIILTRKFVVVGSVILFTLYPL
jgi:hypothetical protein